MLPQVTIHYSIFFFFKINFLTREDFSTKVSEQFKKSMRYPLSDSDNQLPSLPSDSPERRPTPHGTPSDPELSIQEVNSPVHSTPSTPEGQDAAKRARGDASDSDHEADEPQASTSDAAAAAPTATVQQKIM